VGGRGKRRNLGENPLPNVTTTAISPAADLKYWSCEVRILRLTKGRTVRMLIVASRKRVRSCCFAGRLLRRTGELAVGGVIAHGDTVYPTGRHGRFDR